MLPGKRSEAAKVCAVKGRIIQEETETEDPSIKSVSIRDHNADASGAIGVAEGSAPKGYPPS